MHEQTGNIPFDSPEGFAIEFSLPISYATVLHRRLDTDLALWDDFEANALPLSQLLQLAIDKIYQPQDNQLQIVNMACGTKGATEAWAAHIATVRMQAQGIPIHISSLGVDNNPASIRESEERSQNLSQTPSLIEGSSQQFITVDGGDSVWTAEISPNTPLIILMRHPDNTHYEESFQRITDTCVTIIEKKNQVGKQALFIVTTPSDVSEEGMIALSQMESSLKKLENPSRSKILQRMETNKFPTRKMIYQDDGRISSLGN